MGCVRVLILPGIWWIARSFWVGRCKVIGEECASEIRHAWKVTFFWCRNFFKSERERERVGMAMMMMIACARVSGKKVDSELLILKMRLDYWFLTSSRPCPLLWIFSFHFFKKLSACLNHLKVDFLTKGMRVRYEFGRGTWNARPSLQPFERNHSK